jgi:hypothetical protein
MSEKKKIKKPTKKPQIAAAIEEKKVQLEQEEVADNEEAEL